ncbi:MAG: RNA polymerase sigma factor [Chitinophagales bacterium]
MNLQPTTQPHTDQFFIDGIANNNSLILKKIYQRYSHTIYTFIKDNKGSIEDAKDIFQEGLVVIYKMTKKRKVTLTSSFLTFLHSICRRLWWSKLRKGKHFVQVDSIPPNTQSESSVEQRYIDDERYGFYQEKMQDLPSKQRQVLELYLEGKKMREIASIAGLKNESYAKKYKYKCKQLLLERAARDRRYMELVR